MNLKSLSDKDFMDFVALVVVAYRGEMPYESLDTAWNEFKLTNDAIRSITLQCFTLLLGTLPPSQEELQDIFGDQYNTYRQRIQTIAKSKTPPVETLSDVMLAQLTGYMFVSHKDGKKISYKQAWEDCCDMQTDDIKKVHSTAIKYYLKYRPSEKELLEIFGQEIYDLLQSAYKKTLTDKLQKMIGKDVKVISTDDDIEGIVKMIQGTYGDIPVDVVKLDKDGLEKLLKSGSLDADAIFSSKSTKTMHTSELVKKLTEADKKGEEIEKPVDPGSFGLSA